MDLKTIVTACIVIIGWWVVYYFSQLKDRKNRKHDLRTEYLINTFNELTSLRSYSKVLNIEEVGKILVKILGSIELYGTEKQIQLVQRMAEEMSNEGKIPSISPLIDDLRDDLRNELQLNKVNGQVSMFLVNKSHNKAN